MEITPQNQVPEQLDRKDMLLENLVAQGEKNHQESSALLENVLAQGADKGNTEPLLEASLEMQNKTHETIEEKGTEIAEAVKGLKPAMDAASFLANFMQAIKGEKGEQGDKPVKGEDYFTEEDKKELAKLVEAQIKVPEDGHTPVKGQDYFTQDEIDDITDEILSLIPIPENGKDADPVDYERIISEVLSKIPNKDLDYNQAIKEAISQLPKPEKPIAITESYILEKIKGKISYNDLKDIPTIFNGGKGMGGNGFLSGLADVFLDTEPANGKVLTYNSTTKKWYAGAAGGGSAIEVFDEGVSLTSAVASFNFVGAGVTATAVGDAVTVTINGGGTVDGSGTANELAYWVDTDTLGALAVTTYPSLTELSYVKGVTSAIQTQLNGKQASGTYVTSVSGTSNRITSSGGTTPVIDISASYVGQSSITTLGTITTGVWNGTDIAVGAGGTGLGTIAALSILVANVLDTFVALTPGAGQSIRINAGNTAWEAYTPGSGGGVAIGDTITSGTAGSVLFLGASNVLAQDNAKFFFDNTNDYLGIGTATPDRTLHSETADAVTNAVTYGLRITHTTSGTATTNFGVGTEYELENASGTNRIAATIETYYTDATNGSEDANFIIKLIKAGALSTGFMFSHDMNRLYSGTGGTGITIPAAGGTSAIVSANGELDLIPNTGSDIGLRIISVSVFGTSDLFFQAKPGGSGYGVFEGYGGQGTVISSDSRVIIAPSRVEYVRWEGNTMTFKDAIDIAFNGTTGTKFGTATTQKIGFWNATPIVRPTALTTQLTSITHTAPGTPDYAVQDLTNVAPYGFVTKDEGNTVLSVILNLQTRVGELETKLQAIGLIA